CNLIVVSSPMDGSHSLLFRSDSSLALRWGLLPSTGLSPIKSGTYCTSMSLVIRSRDSQETLRAWGGEAGASTLSRRAMGAQAHSRAAPPHPRGTTAPPPRSPPPHPPPPPAANFPHTLPHP